MKNTIQKENNQAGTVLILMAGFVVFVVAMLALVIDLSVSSSSHTKLRRNAEYAALGALEAFLKTPSGGPQNAKLKAALLKAQQLTGFSDNFILAKPFLEDPNDTQNFLCSIDINANCANAPIAQTTHGALVAGKWHFSAPDTDGDGIACEPLEYTTQDTALSPTCPCNAGAWAGEPCFEPLKNPEDPNSPPNAFRVNLQLKSDSFIRTLFASIPVVGKNRMFIAANATAALVPRHGVFLIDLSPSTHAETHLRDLTAPATDPRQSESSFLLDASYGACPTSCVAQCNCKVVDFTTLFNSIDCFQPTASQVDYMDDARPSPGMSVTDCADPSAPGECPPWKHFRSDYQCQEVTYSEDGGPAKTERYLVDVYKNLNPTLPQNKYSGPEPLNSMLSGVYEALDEFETRAVSGDLAAIVGFDQTVDITPQGGGHMRNFPLTSPGSQTFDEMKKLSDVENPNYDPLQERASHLFLPRPKKYTNLPAALIHAQDLLAQAPGADSAESFVVLFTDGMTNVNIANLGTGGPSDDKVCTLDSPCSPGWAANPISMYFWISMFQSFELLVNDGGKLDTFTDPVIRSFRDQNIALHTFLVGSQVGPHTLLVSDGGGSCMSDTDARKRQPLTPFVEPGLNCPPYSTSTTSGGSWFNKYCKWNEVTRLWKAHLADPDGVKFTYPNTLYWATVLTHGLWAPLREPCPVGSVNPTFLCNGVAGSHTPPVVTNPLTGETLVDSSGRLFCDPGDPNDHVNPGVPRSKRDQVKHYIRQIMEQNPFIIVE